MTWWRLDGFTGFKTATTKQLPDAVAVVVPFHTVRLPGAAVPAGGRGDAYVARIAHICGVTLLSAWTGLFTGEIQKPVIGASSRGKGARVAGRR